MSEIRKGQFSTNADEMKNENDKNSFEELINLAESIQNSMAMLKRNMYIYTLGGFVSILLLYGPIIFFQTSNFKLFSFEFLLLPFIASVVFVYSAFQYKRVRNQLNREMRAYEEVMPIVHEVFDAHKSEMSPLQLAKIKIRLARMDN